MNARKSLVRCINVSACLCLLSGCSSQYSNEIYFNNEKVSQDVILPDGREVSFLSCWNHSGITISVNDLRKKRIAYLNEGDSSLIDEYTYDCVSVDGHPMIRITGP